MSREKDTTIALFIDFDNVALGARDAQQRFDIKFLMQRILEKGKILVKKAYADWHFYKEHMAPLHEHAIELTEIPTPRISGKNSADIKLVVDAMELCYTKDHIDTFVIVSGDSDFSPLVSKLRENNKRVIGVGVKNSSSHLLINNCDEFIFYDNIYRDAVGTPRRNVGHVPADKKEMFEFLVNTVQGLLQESRGVLYSSLIKDTMTRKMPDFNERSFGYSTFGDLLDDSRRLGLLMVERDLQAGGTWVVHGLGDGKPLENEETKGNRPATRRRRRPGGRGRSAGGERGQSEEDLVGAEKSKGSDSRGDKTDTSVTDSLKVEKAGVESSPRKVSKKKTPVRKTGAKAVPGNKAGSKKTPRKKAPVKTVSVKTDSKKITSTKKVASKKTTSKKAASKKETARKAPAKKATARKTAGKKVTKKTGGRNNPGKN